MDINNQKKQRSWTWLARIALGTLVLAVLLWQVPLLRYVLPFALLGYLIGKGIWGCSAEQRRFLLIVVIVALVLRGLYALMIEGLPGRPAEGFFFPDEGSYDVFSEKIARDWHTGIFPELWKDTYLGTLHTGYYRILATVYYAVGHRPAVAILLNVLVASLVPVLLYFLGLRLIDERGARWAALLGMLHPSFWFWNAFLIKDAFHIVFFLFLLWVLLRLVERVSYVDVLAALGGVFFLSLLRVYSSATLVATLVAYLMFFSKRKRWYWIAGGGLLALLLVGRLVFYVRSYEDQIIYSFLNMLPDEIINHWRLVKHLVRGIPRFVLAPYAWYFSGTFDVHYLLYPGQWFLYLLILPFALKGCAVVFKEDRREWFFLLFPIAVNCFVFLLAYRGSVPRQRLSLEALFILMAAMGFQRKGYRGVLASWYVLFGLFVIAHIISLFVRGIW
jgi:hypothetical protein